MENKDMQGGSQCNCGCGHGMGGMYGHRHGMHILVRVLVAIFIFWAGVQFGELRGMLHGNYSNGYGYGMMGGWSQQGTAPAQ